MAKPKIVLPQKLHKEFRALKAAGDMVGMGAFFDGNNIDINATLYKPEEGKYSYTLFNELFDDMNGILEKIEFFHLRGVDVNARNGIFAQTVLFNLYGHKWDLPILEKLLAMGIDANIPDNEGTTYITKMTQNYGDKFVYDHDKEYRHVDKTESKFEIEFRIIELLLQNGANPSLKNKYDTSALDWVAHRKATDDFAPADAKLEKLFEETGIYNTI